MRLDRFSYKIRSLIKHIARYLWDGLARISISDTPSNRVVLIKVDVVGDFVLWLGSARVLSNHFKGHEIILVANQSVAELADKLDFFDQVLGIDLKAYENNWNYRYRTNRKLFQLGAKMAIQPTCSRNYVTGDALVRATAANERVGSVGDLHLRTRWQRKVGDRWFTKLIDASETPLHELQRHREFLQGLGIKPESGIYPLPELVSLTGSLDINEDYFVLFPGAGIPQRMWPADSFAAVARTVVENYGWRMVVCGSVGESELARRIMAPGELPGAIDLTGKSSLPELVEVIRGARLLIANETSAIHIAAAVDTPSVCLLGGGHFGRFVPYPDTIEAIRPVAVFHQMECFGCNWHCIYHLKQGKPFPCIEAIDSAAVVDAVQRTIEQNDDSTN
jgi:ADP-heptose:LPS heptosyltransferase